MLKSEAELKWCPYAVGAGQVFTETTDVDLTWYDSGWRWDADTEDIDSTQTAHSRDGDGNPKSDCLCITENCMAWLKTGNDSGTCMALDQNIQR